MTEMAKDTKSAPDMDDSARLSHLKALATKEYSLKNYTAAAEHYSEASELQDKLNGEMALENADLLYAYGRCLYHNAVSRSDVLGGKVANDAPKKRKREALDDNGADGSVKEEASAVKTDAYFQIEGDENWTDTEGEDDDAADEPDAEEDDDDFAVAYEILDTARVLFTRRIAQLESSESTSSTAKGKSTSPSPLSSTHRALLERLADTHDLQAEINLEGERFSEAVNDSRQALDVKLRVFPPESSLVAEAHFKHSLALEFAAVNTVASDGSEQDTEQQPEVDMAKRADAATQMEMALASCRLRVQKEEAALQDSKDDERAEKQKSIDEVKDIMSDMENRLAELKDPDFIKKASQGLLSAGSDGAGAGDLGAMGILGSLLGSTPAQQRALLEKATMGANDLSGMVRHKKAPASAANASGSTKRKADDMNDDTQVEKKIKTDDGA